MLVEINGLFCQQQDVRVIGWTSSISIDAQFINDTRAHDATEQIAMSWRLVELSINSARPASVIDADGCKSGGG